MSEIVVKTSYKEIDKVKWDNYVLEHPLGNIFQTPAFYILYSATKNYESLILILEQDDEILGLLQAVIISEGGGFKKKLTTRSLIIGGPLIRNNDLLILNRLINEYEKLLNGKAIYTEIREIFRFPYDSFFMDHGYNEEKRLNILVDLTKPEDKLWSEVHSKRRNEIKRAEKRGILLREINELGDIEMCYNILNEVYNRAKLPLADKSLFLNCYKYLSPLNHARFLGAFFDGELIGVMLTLCFKDRVIDWYAGSSKKHYDKNPNDIIPWEAFKKFRNEGYKVFDFGGAGKPDVAYGVRDYKQKFGGEFVELKRYLKIHKPLLMQTGKLGLKLWQKLK